MPIVSKNEAATGRVATIGRTFVARRTGSPSLKRGAPPQNPRPEIGTQFTADADRHAGQRRERSRIAWCARTIARDRVVAGRQSDLKRQREDGLKPRIDGAQSHETPDQQAGRDQQHERQRHLAGHEHVTRPMSAALAVAPRVPSWSVTRDRPRRASGTAANTSAASATGRARTTA